MIKQITLNNIYNFKEEITIDFDSSSKIGTNFHKYNKDFISNFSLIYGKNNVGKSNFFRALKESVDFIKGEGMVMNPYYPQLKEHPSIFEIIVENENHEIRYGFSLLIKGVRIKDEWMYAKINGSSRESLIFNRENFKTHVSFNKSDLTSLMDLKETSLFLNYFSSFNHKYEIINDFMKAINNFRFIDCVNVEMQDVINNNIFDLLKEKKSHKLFNLLLNIADLDIKEVLFRKLDKEQLDILEKLRAIFESDMDIEIKDQMSQEIVEENIELIPSLLNKDVVSVLNDSETKEARSIEFVHETGAIFRYKDLSSGTKQIVNILSTVVLNMNNPSVFIFDEIEAGLHYNLIDFAMNFFKLSTEKNSELQFLISTHQSALLDYEFIANENKIFLKYDKELKSPIVEYLSEYKLRNYQKISQRYALDAFGTNPNTSKFYILKKEINSDRIEDEKS